MKIFRSLIFISAISFCYLPSSAQLARQKISLYAYNIGFSGISTGLGRAINKEKSEKFFSAFWTGFKHGCIGGSISFAGKHLAHLIKSEESLYWGWPSKIVHSYGVSIMENSVLHKSLFTSIRVPAWFVMMDIDFEKKIHVNAKAMPASMIHFIVFAATSKFSLSKTIQIGVPYFEFHNDPGVLKIAGSAGLNVISINSSYNNEFNAAAHELIHILQLREYYIFNGYWGNSNVNKRIRNSENSLTKFAGKYLYPDVNYVSVPYLLSKWTAKTYYGNIFELEAQHISLNQYITK